MGDCQLRLGYNFFIELAGFQKLQQCQMALYAYIFQSIVSLGSSLNTSHPSYSTDSMGAAREMSSGIVLDMIPANSVLGMHMKISVGSMCPSNASLLESLIVPATLPGVDELSVPPALLFSLSFLQVAMDLAMVFPAIPPLGIMQ